MLYPKEVGECCSLLNLASNALPCIWSSSACGKGDGKREYLRTRKGSCFKLCDSVSPVNNLFFFFPPPARGLDHIAENILSYLDAKSLCAAELVCKEWYRVTSDGMLWKKLIERMVRTDSLWRGLSERRGW